MAEWYQCKTPIHGESRIMCEGVSEKVFHSSKKCSGIDQLAYWILCDDCLQYIYNVDMAIEEIQNRVNKSKDNLVEYKAEF